MRRRSGDAGRGRPHDCRCPVAAARASGAPLLLCCLPDSVVWSAPSAPNLWAECSRSRLARFPRIPRRSSSASRCWCRYESRADRVRRCTSGTADRAERAAFAGAAKGLPADGTPRSRQFIRSISAPDQCQAPPSAHNDDGVVGIDDPTSLTKPQGSTRHFAPARYETVSARGQSRLRRHVGAARWSALRLACGLIPRAVSMPALSRLRTDAGAGRWRW